MTSYKNSTRSLALTGAALAAAFALSACAGSAEAVEPSPGTQPPPTVSITTTTPVVPEPDYYPNETGGDTESSDTSDSGS